MSAKILRERQKGVVDLSLIVVNLGHMKIPILHIAEFEKAEPIPDFYSNSFSEHLAGNRDHFDTPHRHNFFLCVLFTRGSGQHEIDFNSFPVQRGSVFFLRPGQSHFWKFDQEPEGFIFFHTQEFYELHFLNQKLSSFPFYLTDKNPPVLQLSEEKITSAGSLFQQLNKEYLQDRPYKKQRLISLLDLIYINLAREYTRNRPLAGSGSPIYLKTLESLSRMIEESFRSERSAQFYADRLNISAKHLNRITKASLDKTTTDLITERVILEAKRLMVHSQSSFLQIADMLGYPDYAYFSKVFKAKTGLAPQEFRKKYR